MSEFLTQDDINKLLKEYPEPKPDRVKESDINFKDNVYFVKCKVCQGNGYIERELNAEDLSVDEQRRIYRIALKDGSHNVAPFGDAHERMIEDCLSKWKGLKK